MFIVMKSLVFTREWSVWVELKIGSDTRRAYITYPCKSNDF